MQLPKMFEGIIVLIFLIVSGLGALLALSFFVSAFFPAKAFYNNDFHATVGSWQATVILMSIFLTWQTLFGLTVVNSQPAAINSGNASAGGDE